MQRTRSRPRQGAYPCAHPPWSPFAASVEAAVADAALGIPRGGGFSAATYRWHWLQLSPLSACISGAPLPWHMVQFIPGV